MQAESPLKTPSETPSMDLGQLSFAEAQALLSSLDSTLPALNGARASLTARAKHAAGATSDLEKAQSELRILRCAPLLQTDLSVALLEDFTSHPLHAITHQSPEAQLQ